MIGSPVIIEHQDVTDKNADKIRCGVISDAYFNEPDGWYYAEGIIWDDKAISLINDGWSVSCSYDYLAFNDEGGEENNIKYDKEFTELNFTHLAIVNNPRYERANIVFNSKDEEKGKWVTIKGNHIFIPDGKTLDEVIKEKGWGDKGEGKTSKEYKTGDKITFDTNWRGVNPRIQEGEVVGKEKKLGSKGDANPDYQYKVKLSDGKIILVEKEAIQKDKQSDKDRIKIADLKSRENEVLKQFYEAKEGSSEREHLQYELDALKDERFRLEDKQSDNKTNNSKEINKMLLDELKKLIFKVENNKENEEMIDNEKVDKRKLIDEVGGILKGKVDDEIIRTIIKKMEEASYNDSEASADNKKVKNEDDEEKKIDNEEKEEKVDNEEEKKDDKVDNEEDEEKVEELKKEEKKDVENKCKNSKETSTFDKINAIYNSVRALKPQSTYTSRQEKLDNAVEYFKN